MNENETLTVEWIIETLKKSGCNSKQIVIEKLENANSNDLYNLWFSLVYKINNKELEKRNGERNI